MSTTRNNKTSISVSLQGVPLRCEIGPRDMDGNKAVVVRRDTGEKITVETGEQFEAETKRLLETMHEEMYTRRVLFVCDGREWKYAERRRRWTSIRRR